MTTWLTGRTFADGTTQVLVTARKEEARMIRGGGRSRKSFDAKDASEEEEYGEDVEVEPDGGKPPRSLTPTALASSVRYLHADQAARASHIPPDEGGYMEDPSPHHFHPPEVKDNYQVRQAEYAVPVEGNSHLGKFSHPASSANVFHADNFPENPFGTMHDIRSHADIFPLDEQHIIGQWGIPTPSDLFPMHYTGEPSQAPATVPPPGEAVFDHYSYGAPHKQEYRSHVHGYPVDSHGHLLAGYEDDPARSQRINGCAFPPQSIHRLHSAGMMIRQPAYDLPTHIRA